MRQPTAMQGERSRRGFLAGVLAGAGVTAVSLAAPKRAQAAPQASPATTGPILYRRTAETERYYKTLYQ